MPWDGPPVQDQTILESSPGAGAETVPILLDPGESAHVIVGRSAGTGSTDPMQVYVFGWPGGTQWALIPRLSAGITPGDGPYDFTVGPGLYAFKVVVQNVEVIRTDAVGALVEWNKDGIHFKP